jgi:hypothetical protein
VKTPRESGKATFWEAVAKKTREVVYGAQVSVESQVEQPEGLLPVEYFVITHHWLNTVPKICQAVEEDGGMASQSVGPNIENQRL